MKEHASVGALWRDYLTVLGETPENTEKKYSSWHFCDNREDAEQLALLVLRGVKRATASALWCYEEEKEPLPREGDYSIVTDWEGRAVCIVRTLRLQVFPFNEVPPEFAAREGEGDGSLEYWRREHEAAFSRGLREYGLEFREDMPVLCEEFEVVHRKR
ncbi:MAG TPA: ASCH domain-containing protein [Synergistaceae bacterium]|nr:ASCH domain-containing protein [Synergistaceae bacterium]